MSGTSENNAGSANVVNNENQSTEQIVRETYTEYKSGSGTIAMITDPENDRAWIQSTHTVSVDR
ncbi:hypothetical protein [Halopelagius longus]|uniref:Uncharacterized protein n=1 Tax=Halopelagius longus TaxID=1236180 RepID=A0A1H0YR70_9EURY|nr:hypothetical protein [Halopelagius longus]RDI72633.1 hypothetical protein DWB78_13385 [Halopelagius longus]SDQ17653.1 hypothetical protein SAMN05216278_0794 [Halopelagius longus]